jgi:hypothetical protein
MKTMNVIFTNPSCTPPVQESFDRHCRHGKSPVWRSAAPLAIIWAIGVSFAALADHAKAQTDVQADPAHHRQLFENDKVRVVRVTFGPREKAAAMFDAKEVVIVSLTGGAQRLHFPDGTFADPPPSAAGAAFFAPAGRIQPENLRNERLEFIVIEPKACK